MRAVNPFTGEYEVKEHPRNKHEFLRSCLWSLSDEDRQVIYEAIDHIWWVNSHIVKRMQENFGVLRDWLIFLTLIGVVVTAVILPNTGLPWYGVVAIVVVQLVGSFVVAASLGQWILDSYILGKRSTEKKPSKIKQFFTLLGGK